MDIRIDPDSPVPIYMQIVQACKHQVATGRLKPGEQLPTVRELAAVLRINPNTVARAYEQLNSDNVISTQQGRGTYVRDRPDDQHLAKIRDEQLTTMMDSAIAKALSTGYTCDQVRAAFDICLEHWQDARKTSG